MIPNFVLHVAEYV